MCIIAIVCVAAGTWQISRFEQKVDENDVLRHNDHAPVAPVDGLVPLVGTAASDPTRDQIDYRRVRVTGHFDGAHQSLVRNRTIEDGGPVGYLVVTPFVTASGTLLVVRGFIADRGLDDPQPPAPPEGPVTLTARLHLGESRDDKADELPTPQVESVNVTQQGDRLRGPLYRAYAALAAKQPGAERLTPIPEPDLSNPAGGALEPQHFAYVIQWYLFALLALAAPFAMARSERRQRPLGEIDDPAPDTADAARAAKLADRYGRVR
jgi:cytochrome oxidase assembly protein ShyY1